MPGPDPIPDARARGAVTRGAVTRDAATRDALTLEAGGARLTIVPALGGRVTSLRLAGREWLTAGGWDECLPTVDACEVDVPGAGRVRLPDGGDAPAQAAPTERLAAPAGAAAAVTRWTGRAMPYAFERTLTARADGTVHAAYALTSRADVPLPVGWCARPRLALPPDTRLDLPVAGRVRVWAEQGVALGGRGAEHRWPVLRVGGRDATRFGPREVDFTRPALTPQRFGPDGRSGYACALVLDRPTAAGASGRVGVEQAGARLELAADPGEVPHVLVLLDAAAGTLALAPALAAAPSLDAALDAAPAGGGGWGPPVWLAPGETRRWTLTWRGRAAPAEF